MRQGKRIVEWRHGESIMKLYDDEAQVKMKYWHRKVLLRQSQVK